MHSKLLNPYIGKGCNVTINNFFTSIKLAKKLEIKKTSIVGTINRNRQEIPTDITAIKILLYSTIVLKTIIQPQQFIKLNYPRISFYSATIS